MASDRDSMIGNAAGLQPWRRRFVLLRGPKHFTLGQLLEIAAAYVLRLFLQLGNPEALGDQVGHAVLDLKFSGDAEEGFGFGDDLVLLENFLPDDEVYESGFVFKGHEHDASCCPGALAADDHAGIVERGTVFHLSDRGGVGKSAAGEFVTEGGQWMSAGAVASRLVIPADRLKWV